jgi:hypothetical protein
MRQPIFVPSLSPAEHDALTQALRSKDAFTLRRAQILLASAHGHKPAAIAATYGCTDQTVRNVIHDFHVRDTALHACSTARHGFPHLAQRLAGHLFDLREFLRTAVGILGDQLTRQFALKEF